MGDATERDLQQDRALAGSRDDESRLLAEEVQVANDPPRPGEPRAGREPPAAD